MKRLLLLNVLFACLGIGVHAQILVKDPKSLGKKNSIIEKRNSALNFLVMGDWGRVGEDHQKPVAIQMGKTAAQLKAEFIIAVGDNFYPSGVISEFDPLFRYSFEDIYTAFSLQWDWYVVLGNHDYKSNPDAQVAYSKISRRWKMPARYYSKKFSINGDTTQQVLIAFIDTNPLIPEFYSNKDYGPNVRNADSSAQKQWLEKVLSDTSSSIKWKIVVGHHPMYTGGGRTDGYDTKAIRNSLLPLFDKYGVDVYLAGHEHSLQHLVASGKTQHYISGSASERTPVHMVPEAKMVASEYGFMIFTVTGNELLQQTIDYTGKVIYTNTISKK